MGTPAYAELRCKTNFSFLEGASHPEELVQRARELELSALAVTDRDGVYGVVRAHTAAKECGLPLIVGAEMTLNARGLKIPIVLLVTSRQGYANLCRLISTTKQAAPKGETFLRWEDLRSRSGDLLALSPPPYDAPTLEHLKEIFGARLFIALHRTLEASDIRRTVEAIEQSKQFSIPIVATNDVHYHAAGRQALHDVLTAIRHRTTVEKAGHLLFSNAERRLKSVREMAVLFSDRPEALRRSVELAEQCCFSLDELRYVYPDEFLPAGKTAHEFLSELTWGGAERTYASGIPDDVRRQLTHELRLIRELRFEDYFLTIWDIVRYARSRGILCQGRGSAANSAVCYVLGITAIDPVRMNLLFERFLSAERGEPPDIDVDFEHERREEVIQYIFQRYGRDRAGMVAEVICYRERSALREVSKALGLSHERANNLATSYHRRDYGEINEQFLKDRGVNSSATFSKQLLSLVTQIGGFPRHLGTHVGGFVLTKDPLIESVPIENAAMPNRTIIQWDKNDLAAVGMLKVDILGLGMLTALRKCFDSINNSDKRSLSLSAIPPEDPVVYEMICQADTVGVFQVESRAQMGMLPRLQPRTFPDLVIEVAIVRPGPIQGGMVHPFLRRRRGEEKIRYAHPALESILAKTCGVPLFQEQVMKMAVAVAGFSAGEADQLRRAMGIWRTSRSKSILSLADRLIGGLKKNGIAHADALEIFKQIESFGEFGFPESHSASFALLVYASAYLKCYYPVAFTCALLNSQPMGFYAPHSLIEDLRRHHHEIRPVDISSSGWDCALEHPALRLGFRLVRAISRTTANQIISKRTARPFASLEDFFVRTGLNRTQLFYLAAADAFSSFGLDRRQALWKLEALFLSHTELDGDRPLPEPRVHFPVLSPPERVLTDYEAVGVSVFAHPAALVREQLERYGAIPADQLTRETPGKKARAGGWVIVRQSPPTAHGMVFLTLEDETGFVNVAVDPKNYQRLRGTLHHSFLLIEGALQRDGLAVSILASDAWPLRFDDGSKTFSLKSRNFH